MICKYIWMIYILADSLMCSMINFQLIFKNVGNIFKTNKSVVQEFGM